MIKGQYFGPREHTDLYVGRVSRSLCVKCGKASPREGKTQCEGCIIRRRSLYLADKERANRMAAENNKNIRMIVLNHYGHLCACCGETRYEFLTIDHMLKNGAEHRRKIGPYIYRWLIANRFPPGFRLLCMNCNWALGKYGFCPHSLLSLSVKEAA